MLSGQLPLDEVVGVIESYNVVYHMRLNVEDVIRELHDIESIQVRLSFFFCEYLCVNFFSSGCERKLSAFVSFV